MRINLNSIRFHYVLALLVGLLIADGIITEFVINSGMGCEGNPVMRGLLSSGHFMLAKVAGSALVALLLADIYRRQPRLAAVAAWLFVLVYIGIVFWNLGGVALVAIINA